MPLPPNGTLGLMGFSRPGETSQSRPKQAMIIRMSGKTLDLLESLPQLHFDFSENPGITIGDTFFPVTSVPETSPHELYLRTSSQAKPNAPLKLYANVTGKFIVERQLDDRIGRPSNLDAQSQPTRPTTIFVETPTDLPPPNGKKKKEAPTSTMFRKPVRPADQPRRPLPATSATTSPGGASPALPQSHRSKEALLALRNRILRCIVASERTSEHVVKLVGGNDCSAATRRDILELLDEIAEPVPLPNNSKSPKTYRLKTKSWLEVRPYEIPGLSESERTNMARSAKLALRDLKIPESDPAWVHVQYRNPNGTSSSSTSRKQPPKGAGSSKVGQASEPPKRGITSVVATKGKKPKDIGEIMMKNESLKAASSRGPTSSTRDDDTGRALPLKPPATRPRPGSGFKAKQATPTESRDFANGRSPVINGKAVLGEPSSGSQEARRSQSSSSAHAAEQRTSGIPGQKIEKLRRDDVTASDSERSDRVRDKERERTLKSRDREREGKERNRKERDSEKDREREGDKKDLEKQRARERAKRREVEMESDRERERVRKKTRGREWSLEREEGEHSDDSLRPPKRKKLNREDEEHETSLRATIKKPKMESPSSRDTKARDLSLPKKPEAELLQRPQVIKKESSPLPSLPRMKKEPSPLASLPKIKKEPTPMSKVSAPPTKTSSSTSSNQAVSSRQRPITKRRRGSDIYTSSEDEGEIRPSIKRETVTTTALPTANRRDDPSSQSRSHTTKLPPVHDHAALRNHYDTSYLPYLGNFQVLMNQKAKLCDLLKKAEKGSSGSVTESEGDGDLLDPEELKKLASEYYNQHGDLENIQQIFSGKD